MAAATATALVSDPPRPSVVMLPALVDALEAGDDGDLAAVDRLEDLRPSMVLMRALVNASSVRIRTWWPRSERALPPSAWMAMAVSAALTCSPVAAMASISRASGTFGDVVREREQAVGLAAHRADDDHDAVARALRGEGAPRDVADAVDRADRGTAELLDDEGHGDPRAAALDGRRLATPSMLR